MIQLATALPTIAIGPVQPNPAISAEVSGFALAIGALMPKIAAPQLGPEGNDGAAPILLPNRQKLADGGKELPVALPEIDGAGEEAHAEAKPGDDSDADSDDAEPAPPAPPAPFAWFATVPMPAPAPVKTESGVAGTASPAPAEAPVQRKIASDISEHTANATPEIAAGMADSAAAAPVGTPAPAPASPKGAKRGEAPVQRDDKGEAATAPGQRLASASPSIPLPAAAPAGQAGAPVAAAPAPTAAGTSETVTPPFAAPADPSADALEASAAPATPDRPAAPEFHAPHDLRKAAADAPVVRIALEQPAPARTVSIGDVTPAQRETAATAAPQLAAAFGRAEPAPAAKADPQGENLGTLAAPATGVQTAAAAAAPARSEHPALDMRRPEWTAKMIDTIEALRDAAPLRETRLSLMPEALGKVEVAIRQDDAGTIHVQFNTDTQAARQIIADAQPKLAEIAEQRGIRLGSTQVETSAGQTGTGSGTANPQMNQGQRHDATPNRHQPSAPPSARRETEASTASDERIA